MGQHLPRLAMLYRRISPWLLIAITALALWGGLTADPQPRPKVGDAPRQELRMRVGGLLYRRVGPGVPTSSTIPFTHVVQCRYIPLGPIIWGTGWYVGQGATADVWRLEIGLNQIWWVFFIGTLWAMLRWLTPPIPDDGVGAALYLKTVRGRLKTTAALVVGLLIAVAAVWIGAAQQSNFRRMTRTPALGPDQLELQRDLHAPFTTDTMPGTVGQLILAPAVNPMDDSFQGGLMGRRGTPGQAFAAVTLNPRHLTFLSALPAAVWLWSLAQYRRTRRRLQQGLCSRCGYDLRATPKRCPECGLPVSTNG